MAIFSPKNPVSYENFMEFQKKRTKEPFSSTTVNESMRIASRKL